MPHSFLATFRRWLSERPETGAKRVADVLRLRRWRKSAYPGFRAAKRPAGLVRKKGPQGTWRIMKLSWWWWMMVDHISWYRIHWTGMFTLQGTNISHPKAFLKMIFLLSRWDMLVSWRVPACCTHQTSSIHLGKYTVGYWHIFPKHSRNTSSEAENDEINFSMFFPVWLIDWLIDWLFVCLLACLLRLFVPSFLPFFLPLCVCSCLWWA